MRLLLPVAVLVLFGCGAPDAAAPLTPNPRDGGVSEAKSGCWDPVDDTKSAAFAAQLDNGVRNHGLNGAAFGVAFQDDHKLWVGASGFSRVESGEQWQPQRSSRIGSVTKTFTAALIFLLESEQRLSLDDPIEKWVPGYYEGLGVTIRHLLANTSGIPSYNYVGSFDSTRAWTPAELVQWAVDQEPMLRFEPGTEWYYSNTNFVLLGMIIEAVTGATYEQLVAERLTRPLGLDDTYIAISGDKNPAIVDCYDVDGTNLTSRSDPSFGWAAGAGVSTPCDLARWAVALYGGEVLSADALTRMLTPTVLADGTVLETGLGAFVEIDGTDALYGHTGGYDGYLTYMYYWKADRIAVVAMSNTFETDLRDFSAYAWSVALGFEHP